LIKYKIMIPVMSFSHIEYKTRIDSRIDIVKLVLFWPLNLIIICLLLLLLLRN